MRLNKQRKYNKNYLFVAIFIQILFAKYEHIYYLILLKYITISS